MVQYCFISVVGTQIMGTINPLMALLEDGLKIARVHLLVSEDVLDISARLEDFCRSRDLVVEAELIVMPPYPDGITPLAHEAALATAQAATERGETCVFNLGGSTNQMIAQCCLALSPFKPHYIQATKKRVLLDANGALRQCRPAQPLPAQTILALQGAEVHTNDTEGMGQDIVALCKHYRISSPAALLTNKHIGGLDFDCIWTDANNRLIFLTSCLGDTNSTHDRAQRLAHERGIAHWGASKDRSWHMFDRTVHVLVSNENSAEHIRSESAGKVQAHVIPGGQNNKQALITTLKKIFTPFDMSPVQNIQAKKHAPFVLEANTLVTALGDKPSATLLAIATHKPKHVVLCHTEDLEKEGARLRELKEAFHLESVRRVFCNFEGFDLLNRFAIPEQPETVSVNISPGTKGQGAYLALWAHKAGSAVWAMQPQTQTIERLDTPASALPLRAPDPLYVISLRGERMQCDTTDQETYALRNAALLAFLRSALGSQWEKDVFKMPIKIDDVTLHRPSRKDWELRLADGTIYPFSETGGEWLELLAAQAFAEAGAHYAHARVRNMGSVEREEAIMSKRGKDADTHLTDMDVVGSFGGGHFLVSCKALTCEPEQKAIVEVRNMAQNVDRFTVALLCHLGCHKAYYDKEHKVRVFGWRELCQPELLRSFLQELREQFDTHKQRQKI